MEKTIVTGGAGFIGHHLCKKLLKMGYEVIVFDNFSDYYSPSIKKLNANELKELGATITQGSILNKKDLRIFNSNVDIVFHLAAQPGVRYSTENPDITLRTNVEGTSLVLSACAKYKIRKIIVASSSSVFGNCQFIPINEKHPKNPISYYGASKLAVEQICEVSRNLYPELNISIIRPFTVIGPRQRPDMAINLFISRALKNEKIQIYGTGEQTRDWTHVDNIVQAAIALAKSSKIRNEDFNIGSGIKNSVNEVLAMISEIIGKELKVEYKTFLSEDVKDTLADIEKAKKLLNYRPLKSVREGIYDFITDYQQKISKIIFK